MKKLILIILLITTLGFASDNIKVNGNVGITSDYVLFGITRSDNEPSLQSMLNVDYNGIYATVHFNSIKVNDNDKIQTWLKTGYCLNFNKEYIKANYVRDESIDNSYEDGNYGEIMFGTKYFEYISLDFYNLYTLDKNSWIIHSATISGNINDKNSVSLTGGINVDTLYYYELNYDYLITKEIKIYTKGVFSDYKNSDIDKKFLSVGINYIF